MVKGMRLVDRLEGDVRAELFEHIFIDRREDHRGMHLAAAQSGQRLLCQLGGWVGDGAHGQRDQHLVGVQARIGVAKVLDLQMLNGREDHGGNEIHIVADVGKRFERIEQRRAACAHQT